MCVFVCMGGGGYLFFTLHVEGIFLLFLGRGSKTFVCFMMDLTGPPPGINNEWSLKVIQVEQ